MSSPPQKKVAYIQRIQNWTIQNLVGNYLEAAKLFNEVCSSHEDRMDFPYQKLWDLCDLTFHIQEQSGLIFKHLARSRVKKIKENHKIEPNLAEKNFIAHVCLLFHSVLVARELKFIHENFSSFSQRYLDSERDFKSHLDVVDAHFRDGVIVLIELLRHHDTNTILHAFILKNRSLVKAALGMSSKKLIKKVVGKGSLDQVFLDAGQYYIESGWQGDALHFFKQCLEISPQSHKAKEFINQIEKTGVTA